MRGLLSETSHHLQDTCLHFVVEALFMNNDFFSGGFTQEESVV